MWFISYYHSTRPNDTGFKFVPGETEAITEVKRLEALGYIITKSAEVPPDGPAVTVIPKD